MILPLTYLPSRVLRRPVSPLEFPLKKSQARLLRDMIKTVRAANGVGLAAPQVGQGLALAIIYLEGLDPKKNNFNAGVPECFPILNPRITESSEEMTTMEEGCLSLPGVFGMVTRPKKITMVAYNELGEEFTMTDDTFLARVLQHEIDHLNNILIVDKMTEITQGEEFLPRFAENILE